MILNTQLRPALGLFLLLSAMTGIAYPLLTMGIARTLFPVQANGSLITRHGEVIGSGLIGQRFIRSEYFWGRPSATGTAPYNGQASGGSNLGPTNPALLDAWRKQAALLRAASLEQRDAIPTDLLTASASGLDPDISPEAAYWQVTRVATMRRMTAEALDGLIRAQTHPRLLGLFGEPTVNVLALNLALDQMAPMR